MAEIMLRVLLLVIVLCGHLVVGANVLLLASDFESSWIRLASIGEALSDRNHQITVLTPESNLKRIQSYGRDRGFTFRTYQTDGDDIGMVNDRIKEMLWEDNMITQVTTLYNYFYTGEQWSLSNGQPSFAGHSAGTLQLPHLDVISTRYPVGSHMGHYKTPSEQLAGTCRKPTMKILHLN
ncbi:Hypp6928 [Branchiostoma lanceolatum]|uniref:Hypp6928 protein n=1 Tax=Branchiostoma lanceolatum TaxID=7740 RepID=A0A8J9YVR2_BRALA|nr:Hypp6928 [Branchiostoma lanceolatum]